MIRFGLSQASSSVVWPNYQSSSSSLKKVATEPPWVSPATRDSSARLRQPQLPSQLQRQLSVAAKVSRLPRQVLSPHLHGADLGVAAAVLSLSHALEPTFGPTERVFGTGPATWHWSGEGVSAAEYRYYSMCQAVSGQTSKKPTTTPQSKSGITDLLGSLLWRLWRVRDFRVWL